MCQGLADTGLGTGNLLHQLKEAVQGALEECWVSHLPVCEGWLWLAEWLLKGLTDSACDSTWAKCSVSGPLANSRAVSPHSRARYTGVCSFGIDE